MALICYFSFIIYMAINKLRSREIGSIFTTRYQKYVKGGHGLFLRYLFNNKNLYRVAYLLMDWVMLTSVLSHDKLHTRRN